MMDMVETVGLDDIVLCMYDDGFEKISEYIHNGDEMLSTGMIMPLLHDDVYDKHQRYEV